MWVTCDEVFGTNLDLKNHMLKKHTKVNSDEWNYNYCPFQFNDASSLINHLKMSSHQPSKELDKKKTFQEYKQCFTCKMEFDGYYNLMNHRKIVHPSSKRCRNFPKSCTFGKECWYVHSEEPMDIDESPAAKANSWNFKCNLCDEIIDERRDFMKHKK